MNYEIINKNYFSKINEKKYWQFDFSVFSKLENWDSNHFKIGNQRSMTIDLQYYDLISHLSDNRLFAIDDFNALFRALVSYGILEIAKAFNIYPEIVNNILIDIEKKNHVDKFSVLHQKVGCLDLKSERVLNSIKTIIRKYGQNKLGESIGHSNDV